MESQASPIRAIDARLTSVMRVDVHLPKQDVVAARQQRAPASAQKDETPVRQTQSLEPPAPGRLLVEIDVDSGRFVNTLLDPNTEEVIRKYPSDAQLAYSRAVRAYLNAISR
jgi:uncharacterized FlaG/YvyC family protein